MAEERRYPDDLSMWGEKKTSIPEVRAFLDTLGAPDHTFRVIHVAETNGKGSACAYLTEALHHTGYRIGTFVSPHLVDIRERILIDGKMVSSRVFRAAAETVKRQGETEVRAGRNFPAYFEYLYYMTMLFFRGAGCEVVVPETGLGGRLDATNSCVPCLTVLTSISLDYIQYLDGTVKKIAAKKTGIIKKKIPVVYLNVVPSVVGIIAAEAWEIQAPAYPAAPDRTDTCFAFLPAPYQRRNTVPATKAFQVSPEGETGDAQRHMAAVSFPEAVRAIVWTAHIQEMHPDMFLDGTHNADDVLRMVGAGAVLAAKRDKKPLLLTSSMQGKEFAAVAETFVKILHPACICLMPPHTSRGTEVHTLVGTYRNKGAVAVKTYESIGKVLRQMRGEQAEDAILFIAGSLYLAGEILAGESK